MAGRPTYQQVHIDVALTNISVAYTPGGYIADQVFPIIPVTNISNKFFVYTKADWLRLETGLRAPGTRAARGDYAISTCLYFCTEKAIAKQVPDEIVANSDAPLRPLEDATRWCTEQVLLQLENDVATTAFGTGWATSTTPGTLWSNDTSDPIGDVETAVNSVVGSIGKMPNTGVMGRGLYRYVRNHPDIVERLKYSSSPTDPAVVTNAALAALFGIDKVLIGIAVKDTANEGATSSPGFVWGNHMLIAYVAPTATLLNPSAAYTFAYKQREVSRFREDQERSDVVECRMSYVNNVVAADGAYLVKSAA